MYICIYVYMYTHTHFSSYLQRSSSSCQVGYTYRLPVKFSRRPGGMENLTTGRRASLGRFFSGNSIGCRQPWPIICGWFMSKIYWWFSMAMWKLLKGTMFFLWGIPKLFSTKTAEKNPATGPGNPAIFRCCPERQVDEHRQWPHQQGQRTEGTPPDTAKVAKEHDQPR